MPPQSESPTPTPLKRARRGQFTRGVSGNPAGRPTGSRNKATLFEEILGDKAEDLINKVVELALNKENTAALRLCLERLQPIPKERRITLTLPDVNSIEQAPTAVAAIMKSIAEGAITPAEGQTLVNIVEAQIRLLQAQQADQAAKETARENHVLQAELDNQLRDLGAGGEAETTGVN